MCRVPACTYTRELIAAQRSHRPPDGEEYQQGRRRKDERKVYSYRCVGEKPAGVR